MLVWEYFKNNFRKIIGFKLKPKMEVKDYSNRDYLEIIQKFNKKYSDPVKMVSPLYIIGSKNYIYYKLKDMTKYNEKS